LASVGALALRDARFAGWALATAEAAVAGPLQVAVVGPAVRPGAGRPETGPNSNGHGGAAAEMRAATDLLTTDLCAAARLGTSPGLLVVAGEPDAPGVPLLADRGLVGGLPAAYVCRGFVCDAPATAPEVVAAAVRAVRWSVPTS
jgi:hypothetical protein